MPDENVEVAEEVLSNDPPEIEIPLDDERPAVDAPPVNVDVPDPVIER